MAELDLSPAARADLVEIWEFSIERFGPDVADAYFLGFDDAFALLRRHPLAGPEFKTFGRGIRCLIHRRHRIFYRLEADLVLIVRIIHHARNAKRELKR